MSRATIRRLFTARRSPLVIADDILRRRRWSPYPHCSARCPSDIGRPAAGRHCKFRPSAASCWSSSESSRSRAGDAAASHTVPLAGCYCRFCPPAVSRWSSGESARGRATTATALPVVSLDCRWPRFCPPVPSGWPYGGTTRGCSCGTTDPLG